MMSRVDDEDLMRMMSEESAPRRSPSRGGSNNRSASKGRGGMFDFWNISLARPLEATGKVFVLGCVASAGAAFIWGTYKEGSLPGVLGISARRALPGILDSTKPVGEAVQEITSGDSFRAGKPGNKDRDSLRPGAEN